METRAPAIERNSAAIRARRGCGRCSGKGYSPPALESSTICRASRCAVATQGIVLETDRHPLVTVVIPAYNAEATLGDAIESALGQSYGSVEVVVVDDGSTDRTLEIARSFGDRVRIVRGERGGVRAARDRGLAVARGEYIAWLDADDVALPDRISVQVAVLQAWPEVAVVSSSFQPFDADGDLPQTIHDYYSRLADSNALADVYPKSAMVRVGVDDVQVRSGAIAEEIAFANFVHPPTVLIRKSALDRIDGVPSNLPVSDDWIRFVQLAEEGDFAFVERDLLRYRRSEDQVTDLRFAAQSARDSLAATEIIFGLRRDLVERYPERVRKAFGERHLAIGSALADESLTESVPHLWKAVLRLGPSPVAARCWVRAMLPKEVLRAYPRMRRWVRSARA